MTRLRFTVYDTSHFAQARYCALVRKSLSASTAFGDAQVIADAGGTGLDAIPGALRLTASPIGSRKTIDNGSYA